MRISQTGVDLIKHFEGLSLSSYEDIAGIWTIGYGHTGTEVGPDQEISEDEAEDLLRKDLQRFEEGINGAVKVDINQNQFDALVSLAYNIGLGAFRGSTALRRLNAKDYQGAAEAITMWNKATINGKKQVVNGLVRRRAAEKALFLEPVDASPVVETQDDSSRVTPDAEDGGRRKNLSGSRTLEGAAVAGAGGAASAGAAWMGRNKDSDAAGNVAPDEDVPDTGSAGSESPDTGPQETPPADTGEPDTATTPDSTEDDSPEDGTPGDDGSDAPATHPETQGQTSDEADDAGPGTDTGDGTATESDDLPAPDAPVEDTEELGTEVGTSPTTEVDGGISSAEYTEAFQIVAGVIVVIAVLYIVWARIDDWFNDRR